MEIYYSSYTLVECIEFCTDSKLPYALVCGDSLEDDLYRCGCLDQAGLEASTEVSSTFCTKECSTYECGGWNSGAYYTAYIAYTGIFSLNTTCKISF